MKKIIVIIPLIVLGVWVCWLCYLHVTSNPWNAKTIGEIPTPKGYTRVNAKKGTYADCKDSDVIVITAGVSRKVGESRNDLLMKNSKIISNPVILMDLKKSLPQANCSVTAGLITKIKNRLDHGKRICH